MNPVKLKLLELAVDWDVISSEYTHIAIDKRDGEPCHIRKIDETSNEYVVYYFTRSEPVKRRLHSDSLMILAEKPKAEEEPKTTVPDWTKAPEDYDYWVEYKGTCSFHRREGKCLWSIEGGWLTIDGRNVKVTKRPAPTPEPKTEWNGTGIPPAGTVCDLVLGSVVHRVTVVAKGEVWAVVKPVDGGEEFTVSVEGWTFRKIKTDKEKAVEKMLKELGVKNLDIPGICENLYDAGYRLTEPPKTV